MVRVAIGIIALFSSACSQSSVLTYSQKRPDSGDTAQPPDGSTGGGTGDVIEQDPVYDDTGEGGTGTGGGSGSTPEPTYSWALWTGTRTYSIDKRDPLEADCEGDTVAEEGQQILEELESWEDHCPICSHFYEVTYARSSACSGDVDLSVPEVRGIVLRGSNLEVWRIRDTGSRMEVEIEFNDAPYVDGGASYRFDESWNGDGTVTVAGTLQFPEEGSP